MNRKKVSFGEGLITFIVAAGVILLFIVVLHWIYSGVALAVGWPLVGFWSFAGIVVLLRLLAQWFRGGR